MAKFNNASDLSDLSASQVDGLRNKLADFVAGKAAVAVEAPKEDDGGCCHSSHFDNDGWI